MLINVALIFEIHLINGALFLKEIPLMRFLLSSAAFAALTAFVIAAFLAAVICIELLLLGKILKGKRLMGKSLLT